MFKDKQKADNKYLNVAGSFTDSYIKKFENSIGHNNTFSYCFNTWYNHLNTGQKNEVDYIKEKNKGIIKQAQVQVYNVFRKLMEKLPNFSKDDRAKPRNISGSPSYLKFIIGLIS